MSLSKKQSNIGNKISGVERLTADTNGVMYIGKDTYDKSIKTSLVSLNSSADLIRNSEMAKIEIFDKISPSKVLLLHKANSPFKFTGEIKIFADNAFTTSKFSYLFDNTNDIITKYTNANSVIGSSLMDITLSNGEKYIGFYTENQSNEVDFYLEGYCNNTLDIKIIDIVEGMTLTVSSDISDELYTEIPPIPKTTGAPSRNQPGVVSTKDNKFYLYPSLSSYTGVGNLSYADEYGSISENSDQVFRFDPETMTWEQLKPFPELINIGTAKEISPGKNLIASICKVERNVGSISSDYWYIHDTELDTYTRIVPNHKIHYAATEVVNNIVYQIGGTETNTSTNGVGLFYGLYTYNLETGEETYEPDKFKDLFQSNVNMSSVINTAPLTHCHNASAYCPTTTSIYFMTSCYRYMAKRQIMYRFDIINKTLEEFTYFDQFYYSPRVELSRDWTTLNIITGGLLSYEKNWFNSSSVGTLESQNIIGLTRDIICIDINTKALTYKEKLPYPGFIACASGTFLDGRIILAGGCVASSDSTEADYASFAAATTFGGVPSNHAAIINIGKSKLTTKRTSVTKLIPYYNTSKLSLNDLSTAWYESSSVVDSVGNIVTTSREDTVNGKIHVFNRSSLVWSELTKPTSINYRLNKVNGVSIDYDDASNTTFTSNNPYNFSIKKMENFDGLNNVLTMVGSIAGTISTDDGTGRTLNGTTQFFHYALDTNLVWNPGYMRANKTYFKDKFYEAVSTSYTYDQPEFIYNSTRNVFFILGGKDRMGGYSYGGYGLYLVSTGETIRIPNIKTAEGVVVPAEEYSFKLNNMVKIAENEYMIFGGMRYENDEFKETLNKVFKLKVTVPTSVDDLPYLVYESKGTMPIDFTNESYIRAKKVNTDDIIIYAGKAKDNDGTAIYNYSISSNSYEMLINTPCNMLAEPVVTSDNKIFIPYGLTKQSSGTVKTTPPFSLIHKGRKINWKFSTFGTTPTTIANITWIDPTSKIASVYGAAKVMDSDGNIHYFGGGIQGGYNTAAGTGNVFSSAHIKATITGSTSSDYEVTWSSDNVGYSVFKNLYYNTAILLKNGKIAIIGGFMDIPAGNGIVDTLEAYYAAANKNLIIYDPIANTYSKIPLTFVDTNNTGKIPYINSVCTAFEHEGFLYVTLGTISPNVIDALKTSNYLASFNNVFKIEISTGKIYHLGQTPDFVYWVSKYRGTFIYDNINKNIIIMGNDHTQLNGDVAIPSTNVAIYSILKNKWYFETDITLPDIEINMDAMKLPSYLYTGRKTSALNLTAVNHSNGEIYVIPFSENYGYMSGAKFNPYNNQYIDNVWERLQFNRESPVNNYPATVSGQLSTSNTFLTEMYERPDGKILAVIGNVGYGINLYLNDNYKAFTIIE